ncbi:MAG TPA: hypothetical protein VFW71_12295 [Actinomycetota bacterium]|nr:hypothetical protein [Actinomycetota bacterium]
MAGYFLRLKFALARNGLRSSGRRKVGLVFALIFWVWVAAAGFSLLVAGRDQSVVVPLVFDGFFFAWLTFPLLGFGSDETLDPANLALLPLSRGAIIAGLLVAALLGVPPVATVATLTGTVAHGPFGTPTAIAVLAVVLEMALCIVASRTVTTALSGILRSRRGRDLLVFMFAIVAVVPALAGQLVPRLVVGPGHHGLTLGSSARTLFWLPPGWAARAVILARQGHTLPAVAWLAAVAAVVAVLGWLWSLALQHVLTTAEAGGTTKSRTRSDLFARLGFLPRTRAGAIAAKELRYTWRDPRRRAALVSVALFIVLPAAGLLSRGSDARKPVLFAAVGALVFGMQAMNQFGNDGAAFWLQVASGRDPAEEFRGKNLAAVLLGLSTATVGALALGVVLNAMVYVPATILLAATVLGVTLGVANQVSTLAPFPLPDSVTNMWAGPGCLPAFAGMLALFVIFTLLSPVVVAVLLVLGSSQAALLSVTAVSAAYGLLVWRLGLALATRRLRAKELAILDIVAGRAGA